MLVSKANVQGFSRHYAQIGGVGTLPQYRRRGLGRQCVSALCQHCFSKGVGHIILFTANTNIPAQNLYRSLGFVPVDEFLIAEYAS
jgi:ribosomal protein S18 acetylase RimI-like enzyme